jgi:hypothetical protein
VAATVAGGGAAAAGAADVGRPLPTGMRRDLPDLAGRCRYFVVKSRKWENLMVSAVAVACSHGHAVGSLPRDTVASVAVTPSCFFARSCVPRWHV